MTQKQPSGSILPRTLFFLFILIIILFQWQPALALIAGLFIGIVFGNPFPKQSKTVTKYLLQFSIVGLGFGMNLFKVLEAGKDGFVFTLLTIGGAMGLGFILGRLFKVDRVISYLISVGTAICGGSAIAAVSQSLDADEKEISVSIGTVFILNAVALLIFPAIGHYFNLSQEQFGIWSAIAIHDTSSVVGASSHYGNEALLIATTVKLARALWIIPMVLLTSFVFKKQSTLAAFPWFILLFLAASVINTYLVIPPVITNGIILSAKTGFSITLFLIGAGISLQKIKDVGIRPLLQGITLWVIILLSTLFLIYHY